MKKVLTAFFMAAFLLSIPVFSEGRPLSETETSPGGSALELNQTVGIGRVRTRRRVRRHVRRTRRRHMRRVVRRRYRVVRHRRRMRMRM